MKASHRFRISNAIGVAFILVGIPHTIAFAQSQPEKGAALPHVASAQDPVYPKIALATRVSGTVRLHVSTDGMRVIAIEIVSGPPMLLESARSTVQSWNFEKHTPTSFEVTFEYKLINVYGCKEVDRGVSLDLPAHVEVRDAPGTCIWDKYRRQQKFLREQHVYPVELHLSVDGNSIANPSEVKISSGNNVLTLPVRDGLFLVPEEFATSPTLTFEAVIGKEQIQIGGIHGGTLKDIWNIDLPTSLHLGWKWRLRGVDQHHGCRISFDPLDGDGMGMQVSNCRRPLRK